LGVMRAWVRYSTDETMTILMVIGSSNVGGAEKQFVRLAEELRPQTSLAILVIGKSGPYRKIYRELGLRCIESSGSLFSDVLTTLVAIWRFRPTTLLLWLYRANVIGSITGKILRVPNIVITARNTDWPHNTFPKRLLLKLSSMLASSIVANSNRAADFHKSIGFPSNKIRVIRNFISLSSEVGTRSMREISVFGIAARAVEGKGHFLAINALNEVSRSFPGIKLTMIGQGVSSWDELLKASKSSNFGVDLIEARLDIDNWFANLDVCLALSELWDSDSNFVLEAVSRSIPVICSSNQSIEDIQHLQKIVEPLSVEGVTKEIKRLMSTSFTELELELANLRETLLRSRSKTQISKNWLEIIL
jgi:glycosyltransferase involved in cell wall biosynthesis